MYLKNECPVHSSDLEIFLKQCSPGLPPHPAPSEALYMTVSLQTGEENVEKPETEEEECGEDAVSPWATQLSADVRPAPVQQDTHCQEGKDGEESDRKCQGTCRYLERTTLHVPVDGSH